MSLAEVLKELPAMSVAERQVLMRRALELDEPGLSPGEEDLIEQRLRVHRHDPGSALSLAEMTAKVRSRAGK